MALKSKKTTPEQCRDLLLRAIRNREFSPDKRLRVADVAARFKATPTVVRAVFNDLTAVGILERRPRSGTYVRNVDIKEFLDSSLVRAWLEALAAKLACRRLTEAQLLELDDLARQLDEESLERIPNPARYVDLEIAFHEQIVEASGNIVLRDLARHHHFIVRYIEQHARMDLIPATFPSDHPSHRDLVDVLRKRDPSLAQQSMHRHVLVTALGPVGIELPGEIAG